MNAQLHECYFYGLYMDPEILQSIGVSPASVKNARLQDFRLDLKGVAKVIPSAGSEVWGTVMTLTQSEIDSLYSGKATKQYLPHRVTVITDSEECVEATFYNVPENLEGEINRDYLVRLIGSAKKLSLPKAYISTLESL